MGVVAVSDTVIVPDTFPVEWTLEQPNDPQLRVQVRVRRTLRYLRWPRILTSDPMPFAHAVAVVARWDAGVSNVIAIRVVDDAGPTTLRFTRRHVIELRVVPA